VLLESDVGHVRVLTLNRPAQRNALNTELSRALFGALERADADDEVRVVVLTGTDPAFCAGVDLKEAALRAGTTFSRLEAGGVTRSSRMRTPIIGAINGATYTGGLEIALGCDFLIASEQASFGDTHARVGVLPGGGMTARLPGGVGLRNARMLSMTGNAIDARTAERLGLVTEVVPHETLMERAMELAQSIAETDPATMQALKRMYAEGSATTLGEALAIELDIARSVTPDFAGLAARRDAVMQRNRAQLPDR